MRTIKAHSTASLGEWGAFAISWRHSDAVVTPHFYVNRPTTRTAFCSNRILQTVFTPFVSDPLFHLRDRSTSTALWHDALTQDRMWKRSSSSSSSRDVNSDNLLLFIRARNDCEFVSAEDAGSGNLVPGVPPLDSDGERRDDKLGPPSSIGSLPPTSVADDPPRSRVDPPLRAPPPPVFTPDGRSWLGWNRGPGRGSGLTGDGTPEWLLPPGCSRVEDEWDDRPLEISEPEVGWDLDACAATDKTTSMQRVDP